MVVGVGTGQVGGPGADGVSQPGVRRGAGALLRLGDDPQVQRAGMFSCGPYRAISAAIVDHDDGEAVVGLLGKAAQGGPDGGLLVVRRNDHPEVHGHSSANRTPRLTPPASPMRATRSPGPQRPSSMAVASCSGRVAEATLPHAGSVTTSFSAGMPSTDRSTSR